MLASMRKSSEIRPQVADPPCKTPFCITHHTSPRLCNCLLACQVVLTLGKLYVTLIPASLIPPHLPFPLLLHLSLGWVWLLFSALTRTVSCVCLLLCLPRPEYQVQKGQGLCPIELPSLRCLAQGMASSRHSVHMA